MVPWLSVSPCICVQLSPATSVSSHDLNASGRDGLTSVIEEHFLKLTQSIFPCVWVETGNDLKSGTLIAQSACNAKKNMCYVSKTHCVLRYSLIFFFQWTECVLEMCSSGVCVLRWTGIHVPPATLVRPEMNAWMHFMLIYLLPFSH